MIGEFRLIPIQQCILWQHNPKERTADSTRWQEFVASIRRYGQLMPIIVTVRPDGHYEVVDGHRRIRALQELGHTVVAAYISPLPFAQAIEAYGLAEQLKWRWGEGQILRIVLALGYDLARPMLRPYYQRIFDRVMSALRTDAVLFRIADAGFGPRALRMALRFADDADWPLERVLRAMLRRGEIRDLEDRLKGMRGQQRIAAGRALLSAWEEGTDAA